MRPNGRVVWLWWWLGVLVAGCAQTILPGSTTQAPTPPLLSLTLPLATPTPILRLLRTPVLLTTGVIPVTRVVSAPLPVGPPACYETPAGSLWCLGLIRNGLTVPVGQIVVRVYLVRADGTALDAREAHSARLIVGPGENSPYGVLFDTIPAGIVGPVAVLVSAAELTGQASNFGRLEVRDVQSDAHEASYHVSGVVANTTTRPLYQLGLVVTLFAAQDRVTGFRELRWPPDQILAPGESLSFEVDAIPQGLGTVRVEVSAEGQPH